MADPATWTGEIIRRIVLLFGGPAIIAMVAILWSGYNTYKTRKLLEAIEKNTRREE